MIIQPSPEAVVVWVELDGNWKIQGTLKRPRLGAWLHICIQVDPQRNEYSSAVNGEVMGTFSTNMTGAPRSLNMSIADRQRQFLGSVSNVQIFTDSAGQNIQELSGKPCMHTGDILSWNPEDWKVEGSHLQLVEEDKESVCEQQDNYLVAIPVEMDIMEALEICRDKLNRSILPYQADLTSLQSFATWYTNTVGAFDKIWVPFSDDKQEGVFLNLNDQTEAVFLPWGISQPNGGSGQNYVSFSHNLDYRDNPADREGIWSSCLLDSSLLLRLDGLCDNSYIGKLPYS